MSRKPASAVTAVIDRLVRPQHIGLFGHRGVGKTTFLTMLYREAVGGRLPDFRLAAADARTASYLSDKILQLEEGEPIPATLGETELRFHLYHKHDRFDLVVKDYQGEHVALGREEPIKDFLRDCDAVWLCLDVSVADSPGECLRSQQEVEQLVEDHLSSEIPGAPPRPMALVLTKADLMNWEVSRSGDRDTTAKSESVEAGSPPDPTAVTELVDRRFAMTRHALTAHAPNEHALLAISSLRGPSLDSMHQAPELVTETKRATFTLEPTGLAEPLQWLVDVLRKQDQARMNYLWRTAGKDTRLLGRAIETLERRYPGDPSVAQHRRRLQEVRSRARRRNTLVAACAVLAMVLGLWGYDLYGEYAARRFEENNPTELVRIRDRWETYQTWHPTRNLFRSASARVAEENHLHALNQRIREEEAERHFADLDRQAADPDADPEVLWHAFVKLREQYPERNTDDTFETFQDRLRQKRDEEREKRARDALDELIRAEKQTELTVLINQGEALLQEHAETKAAEEIRERLTIYLQRVDERDIQAARDYSARQPTSFFTRRGHYQHYLEHHPDGAFVSEAKVALRTIEAEWDKHDFRKVRDNFQKNPGELTELEKSCHAYLAAHPQGMYAAKTKEVLQWCEQVAVEREYNVTLIRGSFDSKKAHWSSRGLHPSVEIEVNGVIYGPSTIVKRSSEPEWNYVFPRPIRWKLGDPVKIRVKDNYYWYRSIAEFSSDEGAPLAMRMLSGTVYSGKEYISFESDFHIPAMPKLE